MKRTKKYFALAIALIMALALAVPAFADGISENPDASGQEESTETPETTPQNQTETKVTISSANANEKGAKYSAYQLLTAVPNTPAGENAKENYTYAINSKYANALKTVTGKETDLDVFNYLKDFADNSTQIETFGDNMWEQIKNMEADATLDEGIETDLEYGYWLIYETTVGSTSTGGNSGNGTRSKILIDTVGTTALNITTKESLPTVGKKVTKVGDNAAESEDSTSVKVGDVVTYELTATLPSNLPKYEYYWLEIGDILSTGLSFNTDSLVVKTGNTTLTKLTDTTDSDMVKNGKSEKTSGYIVKFDDQKMIIHFNDVKKISSLAANSKIVATYTATVTADAVSGSTGMANGAQIEFSNDPYDPSAGGKQELDNDVKVYTYTLTVNKVDANNTALTGAGFTLRYRADNNSDWANVGTEIKGNDLTSFVFDKLTSGQYQLEETTVPAGYNKANNVEFEVKPNFNANNNTLTGLTITKINNETAPVQDTDPGTMKITIQNVTGTELPSTGGIGTTIFYVTGSVLVIAAVIFFVTKRRVA